MPGGTDSDKKQQQSKDQLAKQQELDDDALELEMDDDADDDEAYELVQNEVIKTILLLGNEIWRNFGQEEVITDYGVFFQHQFYIECFQMAYPSYDFSDLVKATEEVDSAEQMAACIQALINLLSEEILAYDITHIRGDAIVDGDAEHCINLLQILQQISSASMMQDTSAEDSEQLKSESQRLAAQPEAALDRLPNQQSSEKQNSESPDSNLKKSNDNAPKNRANAGEIPKDSPGQVNQDSNGELFDNGLGNMPEMDEPDANNPAYMRGANSSNKHQFLDNLDAEIGMNDDEDDDEQEVDALNQPSIGKLQMPTGTNNRPNNSKLGADKVGDVVGQELDIEFEADIQYNLQNHQGRASAGSSEQQPSAQKPNINQKQQIYDGEEDDPNEYDVDGDGVVDHNDVDIIHDGQQFIDPNEDESPQQSDRELELQQQQELDNLKRQLQKQSQNNFIDDYNEELDGQDEENLDNIHGIQGMPDDEDASDQFNEQNQQLILDDQNLDMDGLQDLASGKVNARRLHLDQNPNQELEDDGEELNLDDIDPALLEAAGQLGLDRDAFAGPDSEMLQHRVNHNGINQVDDEGAPISDEDEDQAEVQGLAEILNDVKADGQHSDEGVGKQILRGGQNIEDDQQLDQDVDGEDDDEHVREMKQKLMYLNNDQVQNQMDGDSNPSDQALQQYEDDQGENQEKLEQDLYGDEDEPMIDTDNLDDKEKALLCRYLQGEYERDPDSLPMPREIVEEFLARNQELLEQLDDMDEDEEEGQDPMEMQKEIPTDDIDDAGEESVNNGIDSNEIVVEGQGDDDQNQQEIEQIHTEAQRQAKMMNMASADQQNTEQALEEQEEDDEIDQNDQLLNSDEQEQQFLQQQQLEQQHRMQVQQQVEVGEINIEGNDQLIGEQQIDTNQQEQFNQMDQNQYMLQQDSAEIQDQITGDVMQATYGEEDDGFEEDDEQNQQQQIYNPQYQHELNQIQEINQDDGNGYLFQNINVLSQQHQGANLTDEQIQFLHQQQQQMNIEQMNLQQQTLAQRKSTGKRKKQLQSNQNSLYSRKPQQMAFFKNNQRGSAAGIVGRAPISAASKKSKKMKLGGNTISHDDDHQALRGKQLVGGLDIEYSAPNKNAQRRTNSYKRPQTAKPKRSAVMASKNKLRQGATAQNNMGIHPSASFKGITSSTPSNRIRVGKYGLAAQGAVGQSVKNMIVPQQSQMFTSFGVPQGGQASLMHGISQRKAASNPKKRYQGLYGSVRGIPPLVKKKTKGQSNQTSVSRLAAKNQRKSQQQMIQQQANIQQQIQLLGAQNKQQNQDQAQNLVEMPILSEEFLNQLNEEQLQALLEQQQQLMMLQQQNQAQVVNANNMSEMQPTSEEQLQSQNQLSEQVDQNGTMPFSNNQFIEGEQMYQIPQKQNLSLQSQALGQPGVRSRGRSKAYAQLAAPQSAARIPSAGRKVTIPASAGGQRASSGSRSAHGSKKRTQKTRSSLNIASSGPLNSGSGVGLANSSSGHQNSIFRSQKMALQIYGNSADSMLNNLISQRKKSSKGGKKRSQPNQAGKALINQLNQIQPGQETYDIQAQLIAQQAQYNKLLAQQQQVGGIQPDQLAIANQLAYGQVQEDQQINGPADIQINDQPEAVITEVSPEQEEGESQNQLNQVNQQQRQQLLLQMQQQQQMLANGQSNIQPLQGQISNIADDLSTEQIIELLQNAADAQQNSQNGAEMDSEVANNFDENGLPLNQQYQGQQLPEEIQLQLQQVLQERMLQQQQQQYLLQQQQMLNPGGNQKSGRVAPVAEAIAGMALNDRVQSYQNICNILTESVAKARKRHGHLTSEKRLGGTTQSANSSPQRPMTNKRTPGIGAKESLEADQRILKQKKQFENLLKQYRMDLKIQETKRQQDLRRAEKIAAREEKIQQMKQKKFEEGMISQQRSQIIKRNAQQARLCKKVYKLASDLEKDKLLEEKKILREKEMHKVSQRQAMVNTIENYYKDKIEMLKERIDQEKFERQVAQEAQKKAFSQIKKELGDQKKKEVERYIQLLQQEDDKFDMANLNLSRLEQEVVRIYKKKQ